MSVDIRAKRDKRNDIPKTPVLPPRKNRGGLLNSDIQTRPNPGTGVTIHDHDSFSHSPVSGKRGYLND